MTVPGEVGQERRKACLCSSGPVVLEVAKIRGLQLLKGTLRTRCKCPLKSMDFGFPRKSAVAAQGP